MLISNLTELGTHFTQLTIRALKFSNSNDRVILYNQRINKIVFIKTERILTKEQKINHTVSKRIGWGQEKKIVCVCVLFLASKWINRFSKTPHVSLSSRLGKIALTCNRRKWRRFFSVDYILFHRFKYIIYFH